MEPRVETLDLEYQGHPGLIASFLVFAPGGHLLVECGPHSALGAMTAGLAAHGLEPSEVDALFVTHIHLDHAGAAGWWAERGTTVYVHEIGAPHLVDPSKLIRSAGRIYGDRMHTLWGEILPAPAENVRALADGDVVDVCGLEVRALHTPGHASHHHAYRIGELGFVGDSMGIRGGSIPWLDLPAPPPEFDPELWKASLERLRRERFAAVYRTHFGRRDDVADELDQVQSLIEDSVAEVKAMLEADIGRDVMIAEFGEWMIARATAQGADPEALRGEQKLNPRHMSVDGIARYWTKKAEEKR